jgi:hypothetical protein
MSGSEYRESHVEVSGKGSRGIRRGEKEEGWAHNIWGRSIGEPGEQCPVVFALLVTEPASECVCVGGGASPPLAGPVTIYAKTTMPCSPDSSVDRSIV